MSLWAKIQTLQGSAQDQVQSLYGSDFPLEVRHFLASWLESKLSEFDPDNPQHEHYAHALFLSFIKELQAKANSFITNELYVAKRKLEEASRIFQNNYSHRPLDFFKKVKHCLNTEMQIISGLGMDCIAATPTPDSNSLEILYQLEDCRKLSLETGEILRQLDQGHQNIALEYEESSKLAAHLVSLQNSPQMPQNVEIIRQCFNRKNIVDQSINEKVITLKGLQVTIARKLADTFGHLATIQSRILDVDLIRWKREQQLAGNGGRITTSLDVIQDWCESLADIIWLNRRQIKEADRLRESMVYAGNETKEKLESLIVQITHLLSSLITSTFIIEMQPSQVLKTNTRFSATVRLLVGGMLNLHMNPPQVKVTIKSEAQANSLLRNMKSDKRDETCADIINNTGTMEYNQATRQLSIHFRNMLLKKIRRGSDKKSTESVMDEKFSLMFSSQFYIGGQELMFEVWTLSLPVVVTVHGNQEPDAWATITWDNAFAEPGRVPFAVPEKVPWVKLAEALNMKFNSYAGRPLSKDDLHFLAEKAFRSTLNGNLNNLQISWTQFCKDPLPDRNFTFWEWFYAVMKLIKDDLKGPWMDGFILGFLRKDKAEEMLLNNCPAGTFLLRFSDSELGGITIAWINDVSEVFMVQPFTHKDFLIRSLADRIQDLGQIQTLYPDTPKDDSFRKYSTPCGNEAQPTASKGYVKPVLMTHIVGIDSLTGNVMNSNPNTPQFLPPQSPENNMMDSSNTFPNHLRQHHHVPSILDL